MESNIFAELIQKKIADPVKERFQTQNGRIEDCVKRIESLEKQLKDFGKALSEIDWGD